MERDDPDQAPGRILGIVKSIHVGTPRQFVRGRRILVGNQ